MSPKVDAANVAIPPQKVDVQPSWKIKWNDHEIDMFDVNNKYSSAIIDKISLIMTAALFALVGTVLMYTGHSYLGTTSYAIAIYSFSKRNETINKIEKLDHLKEEKNSRIRRNR